MASIKSLTLYSYFYSSASWRVRAVLELKKIPYKYESIHLLDGVQHSEEYVEKNPMHQVPTLKVELSNNDIHMLTQSLAIIQYLEEQYPDNSVYPRDPILRAKSRAIADTIATGVQPFQNLETLVKYGDPVGLERLNPEGRKKVAQFWINLKLGHLENLVRRTAQNYCVGNDLTIADICLVPQLMTARRFEVDMTKFPLLKAIDERLQELDVFKRSHPMACPDAPRTS